MLNFHRHVQFRAIKFRVFRINPTIRPRGIFLRPFTSLLDGSNDLWERLSDCNTIKYDKRAEVNQWRHFGKVVRQRQDAKSDTSWDLLSLLKLTRSFSLDCRFLCRYRLSRLIFSPSLSMVYFNVLLKIYIGLFLHRISEISTALVSYSVRLIYWHKRLEYCKRHGKTMLLDGMQCLISKEPLNSMSLPVIIAPLYFRLQQ